MTFRPARGDDYFGSYLRQYIFQRLPRREISLDTILGQANEDHSLGAKVVLTDDDNPLSKWQDEGIVDSWKCEFIDLIFPLKSYRPKRLGSPQPAVPPFGFKRVIGDPGGRSSIPSSIPFPSDAHFSDNLIFVVMKEALPDIYWEAF